MCVGVSVMRTLCVCACVSIYAYGGVGVVSGCECVRFCVLVQVWVCVGCLCTHVLVLCVYLSVRLGQSLAAGVQWPDSLSFQPQMLMPTSHVTVLRGEGLSR